MSVTEPGRGHRVKYVRSIRYVVYFVRPLTFWTKPSDCDTSFCFWLGAAGDWTDDVFR